MTRKRIFEIIEKADYSDTIVNKTSMTVPMKKILSMIIAVLLLAGCSTKSNIHVHSWTDATCTSPKTCSACGETEGEALGHKWIEATCISPKTCSICGETEGEALGHDWKEATCTDAKTCNRCGATEGDPNGHIVNAWKEVKPASCTEKGEETGKCEICGEEQSRVTKKLKHKYGDWQIINEATCTEKGLKKRVCEKCGFEDTQEIYTKAHEPGEWEVINEATYLDPGTRIRKCEKCGTELYRANFTLSQKDRIKWLKDNCKKNSYNDLERSPNANKGQYVQFSCKILQIVFETKTENKYSEYRAATKGNWDDVVFLCVDNYAELNETWRISKAVETETPQQQEALKKAFDSGVLDTINNGYQYISRAAAEKAVADDSSTYYTYSIETLEDGTQLLMRQRAGVGEYKYIYDVSVKNLRILEDDKITVYGIFEGLTTYTTVLGQSVTIPKIIVLFYE